MNTDWGCRYENLLYTIKYVMNRDNKDVREGFMFTQSPLSLTNSSISLRDLWKIQHSAYSRYKQVLSITLRIQILGMRAGYLQLRKNRGVLEDGDLMTWTALVSTLHTDFWQEESNYRKNWSFIQTKDTKHQHRLWHWFLNYTSLFWQIT